MTARRATRSKIPVMDPSVWPGPYRYAWLIGLVVPLLPFVAWGLVAATGWSLWWWLGPMWLFVFMPILDLVRGTDPTNPPAEAVERLESERFYRLAVYAYIPLQFVSFVWACWYVATHDLSFARNCDLVVVLAEGRLTAAGDPSTALTPDVIAATWGASAQAEA